MASAIVEEKSHEKPLKSSYFEEDRPLSSVEDAKALFQFISPLVKKEEPLIKGPHRCG